MRKHIFSIFMRHKVAANVLMMTMLLAGVVSLSRINIQFLPTFDLDVITVQVVWPGAVAQDVESSIINPLENQLRNLEGLKRMNSTARQSSAAVTLEFYQGTDMSKAVDTVRERVAQIKSLPQRSEKPVITRIEPYEGIANLLIYGPESLSELRDISYQYQKELFALGIGKINIIGLPTNEVVIAFKPLMLRKYKLSVPQLSQLILQNSQDVPAGSVGASSVGQSIRLLSKKRSIAEFEEMVLLREPQGQQVRLGQLANIYRSADEEGVKIYHQGKPAVILKLLRQADDNSLENANKVKQWLKQKQAMLGDSLHIKMYEEKWQLIKQRIDTLLYNGFSGLVLIIIILYLFLDKHIAFWIVVGIPTALLAAVAVLFGIGGSINMVSLFALILTLGIIVDDNIVIGEESLTLIHQQRAVGESIFYACQKMLPAIASSSLTTIAAFFPLLLIGGPMGLVLFDIPLVVICVILASLIECFFILPGHLYHSYQKFGVQQDSPFRQRFDKKFQYFTEHIYLPLLKKCLAHKASVLCSVAGLFLIAISLLAGPYLKFTFFPTPDAKQVVAQVRFLPGTPESKRLQYLASIGEAANLTAQQLQKKYKTQPLIVAKYIMLNRNDISSYKSANGKQYGTYYLELLSTEERPFANATFIKYWQKHIQNSDIAENVTLTSPRAGPPGQDIEISISGKDILKIKKAAIMLKKELAATAGVFAIEDNLPFSQEQLIFKLNEKGRSLGLSETEIGNQIRAAFYGSIAQTDYSPNEEIDIRVVLDDVSKKDINTLNYLPIITKNKTVIPLGDIIDIHYQNSPEVILHEDTVPSAKVAAQVNAEVNNTNHILAQLQAGVFKQISQQQQVYFSLKGRAEMQADTLHDMKLGLILALSIIFIILAWVFSSYRLPLLVMSAIPLGLIGAIFGHAIMGLDLTLMSLFGLFGLSGIVINDSIILVREYQLQIANGLANVQAMIKASQNRLRAVLLTSITTIAGLTPLLFEKSRQAQFLIPMANSICFGLLFSMALILLVIPVLIIMVDKPDSGI